MVARNRVFHRSSDGNVAMMFAVLLIPLLAAAGIAIDMMRANSAQTSISEAADSALIAATRAKLKDPTLPDVKATKIARKNFDANIAHLRGVNVTNLDFTYDSTLKTYRVTGNAWIETVLLQVVGRKKIDLEILSEAKAAAPRPLEIALALDNTGSMDGQKMTDLKKAATDLVDVLMSGPGGKTKVALVPFARHVNVGMSKISAPWLSIPPNGSWDTSSCTLDAAAAAAKGCTEGPSTCYWDGVASPCTSWSCPGGEPVPSTCTPISYPTTWFGCVGSRAAPLDVKDQDYLTVKVPGVLNAGGPDCPTEITPLTNNKGAVKTAIKAMSVNGETYVPGGLFWAHAALSNEVPYTEGMTDADIATQDGVKVLVLMTDGANTASADNWGAHYDSDAAEANAASDALCKEIKSKKIQIYTIAFDVIDPTINQLLKDCASAPSNYFSAADAAQLNTAFATIATSLTDLAISR